MIEEQGKEEKKTEYMPKNHIYRTNIQAPHRNAPAEILTQHLPYKNCANKICMPSHPNLNLLNEICSTHYSHVMNHWLKTLKRVHPRVSSCKHWFLAIIYSSLNTLARESVLSSLSISSQHYECHMNVCCRFLSLPSKSFIVKLHVRVLSN